MPHLEINELVLVHFDIVFNDYQQYSRVLYTFAQNKSFGQLLHYYIETFNLDFLFV